MKAKGRVFLFLFALLFVPMTWAGGGGEGAQSAQKFPEKPIRIICGYAPGGSSDLVCRAVADIVPEYLNGQSIVVVNRDGANGATALAEFVNSAPKDGYTLAMHNAVLLTVTDHLRKMPFTIDDFEHVVGLSTEPMVLLCHVDSPWQTFQDVVKDFKTGGKTLKFGFSGSGGYSHTIQTELWKRADVKGEAISFEGGARTAQALLGKHVDVITIHPPEALPFLLDKSFRPLLLIMRERDNRPELRGVPTIQEVGIDLPYCTVKWLVAPKGTPPEVLAILREAFAKAVNSKKFAEFAERTYLTPLKVKPEDMHQYIADEREQMRKVLVSLGMIK